MAILVAAALCVAGVFQHELWTPDEPREAEVAREMLEAGFAATPTLGGVPFLEKPPLFAWTVAASYAVFGVSAEAARIPSTLFAIGAIVIAYLLGKRAGGRLAGAATAIVLATMWQFSETSHKSVLDIALTFFVAAGHLAFLEAGRRRGVLPYVAIAVCAGLAFLTKAWIGPGLMCAPPIVAWAVMRDWERVRRVLPRAFVAATLGVAALGLPWAMALAREHGWAAVKECLVTEYVGRSVGGAEFTKKGHDNPVWYYLPTLFLVTAPWCLALPAILRNAVLARRGHGRSALWCGLVFVAGVVLLSAPSGKRDLYLLPLVPAAAVPAGVWLARFGRGARPKWDRVTGEVLHALIVVVPVLALAGLHLAAKGRLPERWAEPHVVDALAPFASQTLVALAVVGIAGIVLGRLTRRIEPGPARWRTALAVRFAFAFLVLHGVVRPFVDPLKEMREGSIEAAALVPPDEPLLAFSADETTLAVVPFYSGRIATNAERPAEALRALAAGPAKHLLVMDKDVKRMGAALLARVSLVKAVPISATRELHVYALKP